MSELTDSPLEQVGTVTVERENVKEDGSVAIALPPALNTATLLAYNQTVFSLSPTPTTPQPGEYVLAGDGTATLYPPEGVAIAPGSSVSYIGLAANYQASRRPRANPIIPGAFFYTQWNLSGSISLSRSLKGHPSANATFWSFKGFRASIEQGLAKGKTVYLYGVGYFVDSLRITEYSSNSHPRGEIQIQVGLKGIHDKRGNTLRSPLDKPINIQPLAGGRDKITLNQLAGAARTGYIGANIDIKTSNTRTTTLRSEVEQRAIAVLGFPYYSNPGAVEIRTWGQTTVHFLSDADVISESIEFDLPGHCAFFEGVQLTDEYDNVVLTLDEEGAEEQEGGLVILHEGDPNPEEPPTHIAPKDNTATGGIGSLLNWDDPSAVNLRDPSIAFESGPTKEWREICYWNDTVLWEKYRKWGFIFVALDVYTVAYDGDKTVATYNKPFNLRTYWFLVEESYKTYEYDATDYNYLKRIVTKGEKKARFKQEGQALESVALRRQLMEESLKGVTPEKEARLNKMITLYQYPGELIKEVTGFVNMGSLADKRAISLPVTDTTEHVLAKLRDYYDDIRKPEASETDWVEPKFAQRTIRSSSNYAIVPDPSSTEEEEKPPLTTGQDFLETSEIQIVYPQKDGRKTPEIYRENELTANAEGPGKQRVLRIGRFREMKGRPGTHARLDRSNKRPIPKPADDPNKYKYVLTSYGSTSTPNSPETGSVSYPGVKDPEKGRRCAECELSFKNAQSETCTIQVRYKANYCEGDLLSWRGKLWVIFGIDQTHDIQRRKGVSQVVCSSFTLKLGRYLRSPVQMRRVLKEGASGGAGTTQGVIAAV